MTTTHNTSTPREDSVGGNIDEWIAEQPYTFSLNVHGGPHQMPGMPDRIICYRGYFIGAELKRPSKRAKPSVAQDYVLDLLEAAGAIVGVVKCKADLIALFRRVDSAADR